MKLWKTSRYLQIVKRKEKLIIFHSLFGNLFVASKNIISIFNFLKKPRSLSDLFSHLNIKKRIIKELINYSFLIKNESEEREILEKRLKQRYRLISSGGLIEHLRFLSDSCNLQCSYCSINQLKSSQQSKNYESKKFPWPIAKLATKKFLDLTEKRKKKLVTIRFFGGEPLIDWETYKKVIEYSTQWRSMKIDFYLNTNATLMTDEIADFLKRAKAKVIVSLDGPLESHDALRKYHDNRGSFSETIKGIKKLKEKGANVILNSTLHCYNVKNLKWLIDFSSKMDIKKVGIEDLCFIPKTNYNLLRKDEISAILDVWRYGEKRRVKVVGSWAGFREIDWFPLKQSCYCPGNGGELCITRDGTVYPCYGIQIPLGNIYNLSDIFNHKVYKDLSLYISGNIKDCKDCEIEGPCSGGCAAENLSKTGSIRKVNKEKCYFRKKLTLSLLKEHPAIV